MPTAARAIKPRGNHGGASAVALDVPVDRIRVLIATEHSIVREGLRKLVESEIDFAVVGEAADGEQAFDVVTQLDPDILLLDLMMPRLCGLEVLQRLRDSNTRVRSILLAGRIERSDIMRALELGARGILMRDSPTPLLFKSIRSVMAGEHWVARQTISELVDMLVAAQSSGSVSRQRFALTRRELEVLALIVAGYANRDIANQMRISSDTVKHHLTSIFNKTGASNRLELALFALHHRLVDDGGARRTVADA